MAGERDFSAVGEYPLLVVDGRNVLLTCIHRGLSHIYGQHGSVEVSLPPGAEVSLALTALLDTITTVAGVAGECGAARIVVVDDTGHAPWRKRIFPEYKAARKGKKDERTQLAMTLAKGIGKKESWPVLWGLLGVEVVRAALYEPMEADDIVARLVLDAPGDGYSGAVILSSDGDLHQLVGPTVVQVSPRFRTRKKASEADAHPALITVESLYERFRCAPGDWVFRRAVLGDHSDGVPGVPGIGEQTMGALLEAYGTAANILQAASEGTLEGSAGRRARGLQEPETLALLVRNMALIGLQPPPLSELVFTTPRTYPGGLSGEAELEGVVGDVVRKLLTPDNLAMPASERDEWSRRRITTTVFTGLHQAQTAAERFHSRRDVAPTLRGV
jgi:5'-3' exonuclease